MNKDKFLLFAGIILLILGGIILFILGLSIIIGGIDAYAWDPKFNSDSRLEDIEQNNKYGDNYIVVQQEQKGILEKISNKAEELLWGDQYEGKDNQYYQGNDYPRGYYDDEGYPNDYYEPRVTTKEEFYENKYERYNGEYAREVTIKLIADDKDEISDYYVKINNNGAEIVKKKEFKKDGEAEVTLKSNKAKNKICVQPLDMPDTTQECKKTSAEYVTFTVY